MMNASKTIQVPASTTNLGSGFDALGLALQLYLRVDLQEIRGPKSNFTIRGEGAADLPANSDNLIARVMHRVFEGEGKLAPTLDILISNQIPIARGLGSSAAAIVAGISCFEATTSLELPAEKFFRYAFEFENHPDNITAARFGGFTVSCVGTDGRVTFSRSSMARKLEILLVVPDFQLQTEKARAAIPDEISLRDAVYNIQRSSLTVAALLRNEFGFLRESLRDKLHQPYRAPLIPGFREILDLNDANVPGMIAVCLSGAGPSVLVIAEDNFEEIYLQIARIFKEQGIDSRRFDLQVDNQGRTIS